MSEPTPVHKFVAELHMKILETLHEKGDPVAVLKWLEGTAPDIIRNAIRETQPKAWSIAIEPLIESLTEDQRRGFIAALIAVFAQTVNVK